MNPVSAPNISQPQPVRKQPARTSSQQQASLARPLTPEDRFHYPPNSPPRQSAVVAPFEMDGSFASALSYASSDDAPSRPATPQRPPDDAPRSSPMSRTPVAKTSQGSSAEQEVTPVAKPVKPQPRVRPPAAPPRINSFFGPSTEPQLTVTDVRAHTERIANPNATEFLLELRFKLRITQPGEGER